MPPKGAKINKEEIKKRKWVLEGEAINQHCVKCLLCLFGTFSTKINSNSNWLAWNLIMPFPSLPASVPVKITVLWHLVKVPFSDTAVAATTPTWLPGTARQGVLCRCLPAHVPQGMQAKKCFSSGHCVAKGRAQHPAAWPCQKQACHRSVLRCDAWWWGNAAEKEESISDV